MEFNIRAAMRGRQHLSLSVSLRIPLPDQPLVSKSISVREVTIYVQVGAPARRAVSFCVLAMAVDTAIAAAAAAVSGPAGGGVPAVAAQARPGPGKGPFPRPRGHWGSDGFRYSKHLPRC